MRFWVAFFSLLPMAACSSSKTLGPEELRSQFVEASSAASEAILFLDMVRHGQSTHNFSRGHAENLRDQIDQQLEELSKAQPEPQLRPDTERCRRDLEQLRNEIDRIARSVDDDKALADVAAHVAKISRDLQNGRGGK